MFPSKQEKKSKRDKARLPLSWCVKDFSEKKTKKKKEKGHLSLYLPPLPSQIHEEMQYVCYIAVKLLDLGKNQHTTQQTNPSWAMCKWRTWSTADSLLPENASCSVLTHIAVAKRKKTGSTNPYLLIPNWSHWGQMAWGHVLPCSAFAFPEAQLLFESQLWLPVLHVQRCHFSKLKQEQLFSSAAGIQLQKFLAVLVFSSQMTQKHGRVLTHPMWVCLTGQQGLEAAGGAHAWSSTCLLLCKIQPKKAFKL